MRRPSPGTAALRAYNGLRQLGVGTRVAPPAAPGGSACHACREEQHHLCSVTVSHAASGRMNSYRCACDRLWHAQPLSDDERSLLAHRSVVEAIDSDNREVLDLALASRLYATLVVLGDARD